MKKGLLMLFVAASLFTACKKKGCTDANASNYVADAEKDDESCTYEAYATFYYEQAASIAWGQAGVTTVEVFVGNVSAGSLPVGTYAGPATPDCGDASNVIYATKNLNTSSTSSFTWELKDQSGTVLNSGTWDAVGGQCTLIPITA
jgi:hypothetical protein